MEYINQFLIWFANVTHPETRKVLDNCLERYLENSEEQIPDDASSGWTVKIKLSEEDKKNLWFAEQSDRIFCRYVKYNIVMGILSIALSIMLFFN